MIVVLLLVLVTTIFANPSVYVVSGASFRHNGIYERKKEPEFHYKQLTDYYGHSSFLYTDSSRPNTWIIGYGPTFSTAVAYYRAPATAGRPAFTQWSFVRDKSRVGRKKGNPKPSIRVVGVETNITGVELAKQWQAGEDIITEEHIICKRKIILRNYNDPLYCNGMADCLSGSDELCPYVTVWDGSRRANIPRKQWLTESDGEDDQGNIVCKSLETKWIILPLDNCKRCNRIKDCPTGIDEFNCPPYVSPSFELPVYCCLVVLILGVLLHLGWKAVTQAAQYEAGEVEIIEAMDRQLEEAVDMIVQAVIKDRPFPTASFTIVHNHCGGIDLLIGAAFSFPLEPIARHKLALAIQKEEKRRHGDKWQSCIKGKAGSTKASAIFLDDCNPPGCLKRVAFRADKMLRWLSEPPAHESDTWYGQLWSRAEAKVINGFIPFLKTTSFIFDYVKDLFLFLYFFSKRAFITSKFIKGLIAFHGLTILTI